MGRFGRSPGVSPTVAMTVSSGRSSRSLRGNDLNVCSCVDRERVPMDDGIDNLAAPRFEETLHRPAGHAHMTGRIDLVQSVEIAQTHGLQFIETDTDDLQLPQSDSRGFQKPVAIESAAAAGLLGASYWAAFLLVHDGSIGGLRTEEQATGVAIAVCVFCA